ncbi:hypothetical protein ACLIMP_03905 [Novosphingobium aerophilum]|uniref:hypothetical protein n=1 Tax=Novosphingobium TaxID=165696 RepID=UPI002D7938CA|nr:hypothetical protein [Novosphingobium sp. RL4]WRT93417.1 hypothetical protein U9J33_02590 [Novosphingobium sp. RL4]
MPVVIETFTKWWHLSMLKKDWEPLPDKAEFRNSNVRNGVQFVAKAENRKPAVAQPISRHPLFPAIVALWFAALFGLGSIMVSPALLERIVGATGLGKVLPMATPPLGNTARILFALAMTGLGGLVGLVAGRRVAQTTEAQPARMPFAGFETAESAEEADPAPQANQPRRRRAFALVAEEQPAEALETRPEGEEAPQILNLSELDIDGIVTTQLPASTASEAPAFEDGPSFAPIAAAPDAAPAWTVPGQFPAEETGESREESDDRSEAPFGRVPEWLEPRQEIHSFSPAAWAHEDKTGAEAEDGPETEPAPSTPAPEALNNRLFEAYANKVSEPAEASTPAPGFAASAPPAAESDAAATLPEADTESARNAAERIAAAELETLSQVELLERLALAMEEQRRKRSAVTPSSSAFVGQPAPQPLFAPDAPASSPELPTATEASVTTAKTIAFPAPPFAEPPFTETLRSPLPRLASVAPFALPVHKAPGESEDGPSAISRIPAALRPVGLDSFGNDDDALPGYLPPRHISLAAAPVSLGTAHAVAVEIGPDAFEAGDEEEEDAGRYAEFDALSQDFAYDEKPEDDEEEAVLEQGYSSLLNLSRQAPRQNFVHFDANMLPADAEESGMTQASPDRPFDPPARPDPTETEKALRAALATLQRMSGAA